MFNLIAIAALAISALCAVGSSVWAWKVYESRNGRRASSVPAATSMSKEKSASLESHDEIETAFSVRKDQDLAYGEARHDTETTLSKKLVTIKMPVHVTAQPALSHMNDTMGVQIPLDRPGTEYLIKVISGFDAERTARKEMQPRAEDFLQSIERGREKSS